MKFLKFTLIYITFISFASCMNKYEKSAIGKYELYNYEITNNSVQVDNLAKFFLYENKTFIFKYNNTQLSGNWSAGDNGDWTAVQFVIKNKIIEARLGQDKISFYSLQGFGIENLIDITFIKIK